MNPHRWISILLGAQVVDRVHAKGDGHVASRGGPDVSSSVPGPLVAIQRSLLLARKAHRRAIRGEREALVLRDMALLKLQEEQDRQRRAALCQQREQEKQQQQQQQRQAQREEPRRERHKGVVAPKPAPKGSPIVWIGVARKMKK